MPSVLPDVATDSKQQQNVAKKSMQISFKKHTYFASSKIHLSLQSRITEILEYFFSPFKWNRASLKQIVTQNLKPKQLHQYDTAHIQTPSELQAKSFPEDWCPEEHASAIQAMTFVDKAWSINNKPKNMNTA